MPAKLIEAMLCKKNGHSRSDNRLVAPVARQMMLSNVDVFPQLSRVRKPCPHAQTRSAGEFSDHTCVEYQSPTSFGII